MCPGSCHKRLMPAIVKSSMRYLCGLCGRNFDQKQKMVVSCCESHAFCSGCLADHVKGSIRLRLRSVPNPNPNPNPVPQCRHAQLRDIAKSHKSYRFKTSIITTCFRLSCFNTYVHPVQSDVSTLERVPLYVGGARGQEDSRTQRPSSRDTQPRICHCVAHENVSRVCVCMCVPVCVCMC